MRRITALVMAVLLGVVLAACGGDDSTASSDDTSASSDDGGTTGDDGGDTDGSDEDLDLGFIDDDCEFLIAAFANNPLTAAMAGDDPDYEENAARLEALADEAPEEIEDAMATISAAFDEMADALKDIDMSDPRRRSLIPTCSRRSRISSRCSTRSTRKPARPSWTMSARTARAAELVGLGGLLGLLLMV